MKKVMFLIFVFLLVGLVTAHEGSGENHMMGGNNMWSFNWVGMGFGFVFMILFWGLIIWLIVWIINNFTKSKGIRSVESAVDILKKRYAKGEITKKQYEIMKKDISR